MFGPRAPSLALLVALVVAPSTVRAQPVVRVRAETRIELRIEREPERVVVGGTLRDDRGDPLPDRAVEVRITEPAGVSLAREVRRTDERGELSAVFEVAPGSYRVIAVFGGEERYRGVDVHQTLDLSRAHVRLVLSVPDGGRLDLLDLDEPSHALEVRALSEEGGGGLPVDLTNEVGDRLASGTTRDDGSLELTVSSESLGPPAAGRLTVRTAGDDRRAAAQTEVLVVRYRPTRLSLEASPRRARAGEPVRVQVGLSDSAGPLGRKAVGLFANEEHLATVLTDERGRIERDVEIEGEGEISLTARFASDAPWRPAARSEAIPIELVARSATPWEWLLVPIAICAALVFWVQRRWSGPARRAAERATIRPRPAPPGIVAGAALGRAAERREIAGRVLDADEGQPLARATVWLGEGPDARETTTDADGRFAFAEAPDGDYALEVGAGGFEALATRVTVPHRGQWSSAEVRLRSFRQLAVLAYRPVAEALAPSRRWWAFWTPRELAQRAPREQRAEVDRLTDELERAAYDGPPPTRAEVDAIEQRAERVRRAADRPPSP